eukprot:gnl/TRDRNA2_/TRDRNA2_195982_c0_seq1.p1 gnl/TRDRNA2_/TRDRNA2_195982_c0~~gnl/TRDRNA2_/TRDRNA2_195982_c0_seq1.p1  ORF type:complete len:201 (-),score=26.31 gnl/TRDRNA2_/TRDRNA2_195982_c0_seq1:186-788(-)
MRASSVLRGLLGILHRLPALLAQLLTPVLHVLLLSAWWLHVAFYGISLLVLLWYKGRRFTYPPGTLAQEVVVLLMLLSLQTLRLEVGKRGRKVHHAGLIGIYVWLALPAAFLISYHLNFQVYVTQLEIIICALSLAVLGLEAAAGLAFGATLPGSSAQAGIIGAGFLVYLAMLIFASAYEESLVKSRPATALMDSKRRWT